MTPIPHTDSSLLQIRSRQPSLLGLERKQRILACAVLSRRLRASQAMSIVRCKHRHAAHLRSHMIGRRMIRQKTQTPNAILSHYNSLLLRNDLLPCETEALDPGSTQVRRPGLNPLYIGPCENGIRGPFDCTNPKWCASIIDCVSGGACDLFHILCTLCRTHSIPATGDVCVGYVVCITTCLCMQAIQRFDCVSGADVSMGHVLLITTHLYMYKISDET